MKLSGLVALASFSLFPVASGAADATSPVDYTQRNAPFAPAASVAPEKTTPVIDRAVQDRKVEKTTIDKTPAALGDRRAAIDVTESGAKLIREKDSHRPAAVAQPTSAFDHRVAAISTAGDSHRPALVAKYQDDLTAANAVKVTRVSATAPGTTAKLNRFVFRKNAPEPLIAPEGAAVTPAGGASLRK